MYLGCGENRGWMIFPSFSPSSAFHPLFFLQACSNSFGNSEFPLDAEKSMFFLLCLLSPQCGPTPCLEPHRVPFNGLWEYLCQRELPDLPKFIRNIILPGHYQIKLCSAALRITLYIFYVDTVSSDPVIHVSSHKLVEYQ